MKNILLTGFFGFVIGGSLAFAMTFFILVHQMQDLLRINQDIEIVEWNNLAWNAYTSQPPEVAAWTLQNYLDRLEKVYNNRPQKDRYYYYMDFIGHARLMLVENKLHDKNNQTIELQLAIESMKQWSPSTPTNTDGVVELITEIDDKEKTSNLK